MCSPKQDMVLIHTCMPERIGISIFGLSRESLKDGYTEYLPRARYNIASQINTEK